MDSEAQRRGAGKKGWSAVGAGAGRKHGEEETCRNARARKPKEGQDKRRGGLETGWIDKREEEI
jgi:hypothetical protein